MKSLSSKLRRIAHLVIRTNFIKTLEFNFKMLPFKDAVKIPVVIYGKVKFSDLSGKLLFNTPKKYRTVCIGLNTDGFSYSYGTLIKISGTIIFNGPAIFSVNNTIEVVKNGLLEIGECCAFGNSIKIRCWNRIFIGKLTRFASEAQIFDTNFHHIKNTTTGEVFKANGEVKIGAYNWIGNRSTIMKGTITPDWCIVSSNSLLNKDYSDIGVDSIIGGSPAKFIKKGLIRIFNFKEDQEIFKYFYENPSISIYYGSTIRKELNVKVEEIFPGFI